MLTLFHAPHSRSSRIVWLLEEFGATYDLRYVSIRYGDGSGDGPDPSNPHPDRKVPALAHDGALVTESVAVALYLCELMPNAGLAPALGDAERGAFLTWMSWGDNEFGPAVYARMGGSHDPRTTANYDAAVGRLVEALARGPYLMGECFTAVDVMVGAVFAFARQALPSRPEFDAYLARIATRPAFLRAQARDAFPVEAAA